MQDAALSSQNTELLHFPRTKAPLPQVTNEDRNDKSIASYYIGPSFLKHRYPENNGIKAEKAKESLLSLTSLTKKNKQTSLSTQTHPMAPGGYLDLESHSKKKPKNHPHTKKSIKSITCPCLS